MDEFRFMLNEYTDTNYKWVEIMSCTKDISLKFNMSEREVLRVVIEMILTEYPPLQSLDIVSKNILNDIFKSRSLLKLSGPNVFFYYPNIIGRKILLLGESHNKKRKCIDEDLYEVEDWLIDLADISVECLDIFNEKPLASDTYKNRIPMDFSTKSKLTLINNNFVSTRSDVVRYHQIDIRQRLDIIDGKINYKIVPETGWKLTRDISNFSGPTINNSTQKKFVSFLLSLSENEKEIKNEYDLYIKNLNEKADATYEHAESFLIKSTKELNKLKDIDGLLFRQILYKLYCKEIDANKMSFLGILLSITMDIYVLSRLFISFDEKKINRGPKLCRSKTYNKIRNIIIYTGSAHTHIYRKFFQEMFDIEPSIGISTTEDCIRLKEPFDFFA